MAYIYRKARPRADEEDVEYIDETVPYTHVTVWSEPPRFTGLYTAAGDEVWYDTDPIGFRFANNE